MTLNEAQQAVVSSQAPLRVVIAGPGSGKTHTMTEAIKVGMRRTDESYGSFRIAVMTFTNSGANEFRDRLSKWKEEDSGVFGVVSTVLTPPNLVHCGTLHSYCFRLINRFGGLLGYVAGKVTILPQKEVIPRLLAVRDKLGVKISKRDLLSASHDAGIMSRRALVWQEYEFLLKRNNLVDYDRVLEVASALLDLSEVKREVHLDYLFVDEYQDSAMIDQVIYDQIPVKHAMFVGDPDQSIYAFRGAVGMMELVKRPNAEVHRLEANYRSDIRICEVAGRLIAHNNNRIPKQITPTTAVVGHALVESFEDAGQELAWLHNMLVACGDNYEYGSTAVLFRTNHDARLCRDYLGNMGIPVNARKLEEHPPDWERALLLLGLLLSEGGSSILFERYLRLDHQAGTVDRWIIEAQAGGISLEERAHLRAGAGRLTYLAQNGVSESTVRLIEGVCDPDGSVADLIHELHSREETASNDATGVHVGTMHSAKGREWDVVFLPAFEQGIIPNRQAIGVSEGATEPPPSSIVKEILVNADLLEEERRLAFVAVTRARHELYISHVDYRRSQWGGGPAGFGQPSQFIKEMGL